MDPKGYETKPWWPYVKNLQDQISGGGSGGGGGVASIVVTIDQQAGTATCNATRADILNAAKAPAIDLYLNDTNGRQFRYLRMIPCEFVTIRENDFACNFYCMDVKINPNDDDPSVPGTVLGLTYNTFTVITPSRKAILRMRLSLMLDVNQKAISDAAPANALVVSMTNI